MAKRAVVSLDVGGTTVDAACVSADGELIGGVTGSASPSSGTQDGTVTELARIVSEARARAEDAEEDIPVIACALAFPAPFDYAAGMSRMTHKFQAINGVKLGSLLRERTGLPVYFLNDADAFGIGVGWRQLPDVNRFVALTIGTGLGSGFIENGRAVTDGDRVPPGGEVWHLPFRDGILEDYVAARAVTTAYGPGRSAREVSALAAAGDSAAIAAYRALGEALGAGLAPVLTRFAPETVVIGGKVAQSLNLFAPAMREALARASLPDLPVIAAAPGNLALWGAARHCLTEADAQ